MAHALLVDGVQGYIYYANTCSDRHGARCKGSSAEIRETRSQLDARDDRIRSRRPSKGGWPCEPQPAPRDPRRLGPFHDASEPECRGELPRGPRHDRRRKQRIDLGPRSPAGTPRGDSQGATAVMGLRAADIVLSSSASKSLENLETGSDPNSASIARRIRALKPLRRPECAPRSPSPGCWPT